MSNALNTLRMIVSSVIRNVVLSINTLTAFVALEDRCDAIGTNVAVINLKEITLQARATARTHEMMWVPMLS